MDRAWLNDQTECLVEVDTGPLGEAAERPLGLVSFQGAIGVELVSENPLVGDHICIGWARY